MRGSIQVIIERPPRGLQRRSVSPSQCLHEARMPPLASFFITFARIVKTSPPKQYSSFSQYRRPSPVGKPSWLAQGRLEQISLPPSSTVPDLTGIPYKCAETDEMCREAIGRTCVPRFGDARVQNKRALCRSPQVVIKRERLAHASDRLVYTRGISCELSRTFYSNNSPGTTCRYL